MPVHIGEIHSEVTATGGEALPPATGAAGSHGEREWEQWDKLRQAQRRLQADWARTRAEGFDD